MFMCQRLSHLWKKYLLGQRERCFSTGNEKIRKISIDPATKGADNYAVMMTKIIIY